MAKISNPNSPIAKFRERNGKMTLETFGRMFKPPVDKSTVLRWETGRLPVNRALEIERLTGLSRRDLLPKLFKTMPKTEAAE